MACNEGIKKMFICLLNKVCIMKCRNSLDGIPHKIHERIVNFGFYTISKNIKTIFSLRFEFVTEQWKNNEEKIFQVYFFVELSIELTLFEAIC